MEKQNNIVLAPCTTQVTELYNFWKENKGGETMRVKVRSV